MTDIRSRLLGAWRMVDMKIVKGDELLDLPIGPTEECGGLLVYGESGGMSATLSRLGRPSFADASIGGGTLGEKARAFDTFISYTGTFDVNEEKSSVTHRVQYASAPHMVGQALERICIFDGDVLTLDTPPMNFNGEPLGSYIKWAKA
ncbi:lipocalin-like domain-containing protein [Streptomyces mirabilis]|uniref:lipocalin-like domain-containing protein n=1 Tax=Streptomyces mirabilis TaxID=68239 RepID=UPI0036BCF559